MDESDRQDAYSSDSKETIKPETTPDIPGAARTSVADNTATGDFPEAPTETTPGLESTEVIPEPIDAPEAQLGPNAPDQIKTAPSTTAQSANKASTSPRNSKKRNFLILSASVLAVASLGVLAWWFLSDRPEESNSRSDDISSAPIEQPTLGVAITVAEGTVEYTQDTMEWQAASTTTQLKEGDSVRTGDDSRAVLTLDDGSVIRLDANTTVKLVNLTAGQVEVEQGEGAVYSRVVPSDRTYTIRVDGTEYVALGTAFLTTIGDEESGVRVFQSAVKASDLPDVTISEGRQYFRPVGEYAGALEVVDINIDEVADNAFIGWNIARDQENDTFKTKLGILPRIKQRSEQMAEERQASEENRVRAEQKAIEQAEKQQQETSTMRANTASKKVKRGTMVLSSIGKTLHWTYTGEAYYGYKLVYSKTSEAPVFNKDSSVYFSGMNDTSGSLPSKDKIGGGKYYARVCAYIDGTEADGCVDYSNIVIINL